MFRTPELTKAREDYERSIARYARRSELLKTLATLLVCVGR